MMRRHVIYLTLVLTLLLQACGGNDSFKITGEIVGELNSNLYFRYYGNGGLQTGVTSAADGKFEAIGRSAEPTVVEFLDNDDKLLGRAYIANGGELTMTIDLDDMYNNRVTGDEVNEQWCRLVTENADLLRGDDHAKINQLIDNYITSNPDDIAGTLMFVTYYDCSIDPVAAAETMDRLGEAAQVPSLLSQLVLGWGRYGNPAAYGNVGDFEYKVRHSDSVHVFSPKGKAYSLLAISDDHSLRKDSIVRPLKRLYGALPSSKVQIVDIALYNDTLTWSYAVARDSAQWIQAWVPGGIMGEALDGLAIPAVPYFIVTDSAGTQIYRGSSLEQAEKTLKRLIK